MSYARKICESATGQNGEQNFWSGSSILLFRFSKIRKDYRYQAKELKFTYVHESNHENTALPSPTDPVPAH